MICEKCKTEFFEGRNCPNCGALAIYSMEDEYKERKQEWDMENAPAEEEKEKKFKFKINIDPKIIKKVSIIVACVAVIILIVAQIVRFTRNAAHEGQFRVVYSNQTMINSKSGGFSVYGVENAIYSADGNYVYQDTLNYEDIVGEVTDKVASPKGNHFAIITKDGVAEEDIHYYLYYSDKDSVTLIADGSYPYTIVEVTNVGNVIYEVKETGAYLVVLSTDVYEYADGRNNLLIEDIAKCIPCENEQEFIFYNKDMEAYLYKDGSVALIETDYDGVEYVCTVGGDIYYLTEAGYLYQNGEVASLDQNVELGSLKVVANSDKVIYEKNNQVFVIGGNIKTGVCILGEFESYISDLNVVEKSNKLYYAYNGEYYIAKSGAKRISKEAGSSQSTGYDKVFLTYK